MARKNSLISAQVDGNVISFKVAELPAILVDITELSEELQRFAMFHGLIQKISDAAAIAKAELPDDDDAVAAMKRERMQAVAQRLIDGDWNARRESGEGGAPAGIIWRAFLEHARNNGVTAPEAAIREAHEELGIPPADVQP